MGLLNNFKVRIVRLIPVTNTTFEFWVLRFRDLGASYFGLRFRVLRFRNYLSFWPHAHPKSKQYVFHYVLVKVFYPYCFFPVNPFVDETDLSFEKKEKIYERLKI